LNWRLFVPQEWDEESVWNQERRTQARLPEDVHHLEKWRLGLAMIDELSGWGITPAVIIGDGAYGDTTEFRTGLEQRGLDYLLDVKSATSAYPEQVKPEQAPRRPGRGRPPSVRYRQDPSSLKQLALDAGRKAAVTVTWREGTRGKLSSRFLALRVRPANIDLRRQAHKNSEELPVRWLICEWPAKEAEPTKYWLSNLPDQTPLKQLVRLAKMRFRVATVEPLSRENEGSAGCRTSGGHGLGLVA